MPRARMTVRRFSVIRSPTFAPDRRFWLQAVLVEHPDKAEGGSVEVLELLELPGMEALALSRHDLR